MKRHRKKENRINHIRRIKNEKIPAIAVIAVAAVVARAMLRAVMVSDLKKMLKKGSF